MLIYATRKGYDYKGLLVKEIELNFTGDISKVTVCKYEFYKKITGYNTSYKSCFRTERNTK